MKPPKFTMVGTFVAGVIAMLAFVCAAAAQINAYDDAAAYFKTSNWTNGANQGFGFTPWVLATNAFSGGGYRGWYLNNGYAISSATNVSGAAYTNCSWGIYANGAAPAGGNRTVACRGFTSPLTTNVVFELQWMTEGIGSGTTNYAGFVIRNGNSTDSVTACETGYRFEFYYAAGGTDSYLIKDGNGVAVIGLPFAAGYGNSAAGHLNATGLNCEFTLEPNDTYRFVVRSATNNAVFEALLRGYLASASFFLTSAEKQFLVFSGKLVTFEIGIRFLADFLAGDTYFKVHRENHNLDRCRTQFKLVESLEQQEEQMNKLVEQFE